MRTAREAVPVTVHTMHRVVVRGVHAAPPRLTIPRALVRRSRRTRLFVIPVAHLIRAIKVAKRAEIGPSRRRRRRTAAAAHESRRRAGCQRTVVHLQQNHCARESHIRRVVRGVPDRDRTVVQNQCRVLAPRRRRLDGFARRLILSAIVVAEFPHLRRLGCGIVVKLQEVVRSVGKRTRRRYGVAGLTSRGASTRRLHEHRAVRLDPDVPRAAPARVSAPQQQSLVGIRVCVLHVEARVIRAVRGERCRRRDVLAESALHVIR